MDDILVLAPIRWRLRRAVKTLNAGLASLGWEKQHEKLLIGRIEKDFDFLGYRLPPSRFGLPRRQSDDSFAVFTGFPSNSNRPPEAPIAWVSTSNAGGVGRMRAWAGHCPMRGRRRRRDAATSAPPTPNRAKVVGSGTEVCLVQRAHTSLASVPVSNASGSSAVSTESGFELTADQLTATDTCTALDVRR